MYVAHNFTRTFQIFFIILKKDKKGQRVIMRDASVGFDPGNPWEAERVMQGLVVCPSVLSLCSSS